MLVILAISAYYLSREAFLPSSREQTLVVGIEKEPNSIDPAQAISSACADFMINIFDTLIGYQYGTTTIEPRLAASWEQTEPTVWIFHLQHGVKFHDGSALNASAVAFSITRMLDPKVPGSWFLDPIASVDVVDDYTVKIQLKYQFSPILHVLAIPWTGIVSPTAVQKLGDRFFEHPVGSGPFIFDHWTAADELVLTANKEYWRGAPHLEKVVYKFIPASSTRRMELEKGTIHMAFDVSATDILELAKTPGVVTSSEPGMYTNLLIFNNQKPPFNDSRVRKAIAYAVDYDSIINSMMKGLAVRIYSPLPPMFPGYNPNVEKYTLNLTKARQLLVEAGYPNGFSTTIFINAESTIRRDVATMLQANLKEIGITAEIKMMDWAAWMEVLMGKEAEIFLVGWAPDYPDADNYLFSMYSSSSIPVTNLAKFSNPEADRLLVEARTSSDSAQRLRNYERVEEIVVNSAAAIPLYVETVPIVIREDVKGFKPTSMPRELFYVYIA
jgi:peptide/nickel transport system substrate-binding protein